ncbi:MAG: HPr family phosphocarrier protein [Verrucomicrobia bacterium]|nr:HPr family phosphocarrier protein [Verrucomicrobiota bacterium]
MTIKNRFGIHARPAALIVKTVSQFASDVTISREEMIASGKSIMGLLTLEGYQGAVLKVTAVGPDADEVIAALQDLVESKFFED